MSDDDKLHVFDLHSLDKKTKRPTLVAAGKSDRKKINAIQVLSDGSFITAGVKNHLKSWSMIGAVVKPKSIIIKGLAQNHFFSALGMSGNTVYAGCSNGSVYKI